ncbi:MAG: glutathione S-transferase family protein [Burkholderiaceae bacterium]
MNRNVPDLILHHYDFSNYSEKVRLALGYKGLAWSSVVIPPVLPKPDLTPLTGGYRRTPVLQIGADVYCDTRLILRVLERLAPEPILYPEGLVGMATMIASWAESALVHPLILYVSGINQDALPGELLADRARMRDLPVPSEATVLRAAHRNAPLTRIQLRLIEDMLSDGREWICGGRFSFADLTVVHPLWFITARTDRLKHELEPFPFTRAWMARVLACGHGRSSPMTSAEALAIARDAVPGDPGRSTPHPEDPPLGSEVTIRALDYARDDVQGELVLLTDDEVAIRTRNDQVGEMIVHFPRVGYDLRGRGHRH